MTSFAAPAESAGWTARDSLGHLCIFSPTGYETGIKTPFRDDADAVRGVVHDVDTGETFEDTLIFQGGLIGALKNRIGQTVLATVGQGQAKPGQSAPFILTDATGDPAAVAKATKFMEAYQSGQYAAPEQSAAPAGESPEVAAARALLAQKGLV